MVPHSGTTANLYSWVSLAAFGYTGRWKVPTTAGSPQDVKPEAGDKEKNLIGSLRH